jgi:biopolymer transport protein ExbB/biopolymer transport protein TolQ
MGIAARLIAGTMLLMSLVSLVVVFERVLALTASRRDSLAFARSTADLLRDGDMDRAAAAPAMPNAGHLGRVLQAAFRAYRSAPKGDDDLVFESVARALERQAQREVHGMKRGVGVLASVGSTAPFVGLLGTVLGIVNSFETMAVTGSGGLATVSSGIAEALATTALGLVVAIPAVTAYNGLQAWIDARAVDISEASNELLDILARHASKTKATVRVETRPAGAMTTGPQEGVGIEKQTLGLVFFESNASIGAIQPQLATCGGLLVQANGSQYIVAFGHNGAGDPGRGAITAAQQLSKAELAPRILVDIATVSVQNRAGAEPRIFSPLFNKKDRFLSASDPPGIVLTAAAASAVPDQKVAPLPDTTGRFRLENGTDTKAMGTWRPRAASVAVKS